jgi:hypothetical protein
MRCSIVNARERSALTLPRILVWVLTAGLSVLLGPALSPAVVATCQQFLRDGFDVDRTLEEAGSMAETASPDWWVSSGGRFRSTGGLGATLQGALAGADHWRLLYAVSNPIDTDNGYHPQNIFRLVTRCQWKDFDQSVYFRIRRVNRSKSPNRADHNGVFFLHRYLDANNLYYAGLRVDGTAVVKKKLGGVYTTLASRRIYPGTYDRNTSPNLIPLDRWIGLWTSIADQPDGSVAIRIEVYDPVMTGDFTAVLEAMDPGAAAIRSAGHAGIRTDFMDVEFDQYDLRSR